MKEYVRGKNFFLVKEQEGGDIVIKSSGYTIDDKAINENWLLTQLRTLPFKDRSNKPDPFIFEGQKKRLEPFSGKEVYSLYFSPECKGIKDAQEEFSEYLNGKLSKYYTNGSVQRTHGKKVSYVGYSKGALFIAGLDIKQPSKIIFVAPPFSGTITGSKAKVDEVFRRYEQLHELNVFQKAEIKLYQSLFHLIGSERSVDLDMDPGSEFISHLNLDHLSKHKIILIWDKCPANPTIADAVFKRVGKYLRLDKNADGMVSVSSQRTRLMNLEPIEENVLATHPTVMGKAETISMVRFFCLYYKNIKK